MRQFYYAIKSFEVRYSIIVFIVAVIGLFFLRKTIPVSGGDLLVEAHGTLFDMIFFGVFFFFFQKIRERSKEIKRYKEELDDFRGWNEKEAMYKNMGNIKRLLRLGVSSICLSRSYLKGAKLAWGHIKNSRGLLQMDNSDFSYAQLDECEFYLISFKQSRFLDTSFLGTTFMTCSFAEATFNTGRIWKASFHKCDFSNTAFKNLHIQECKFEKCDFSGATFQSCEISVYLKDDLISAGVPASIINTINWFNPNQFWEDYASGKL